ncbi:MAG: hypothetical protein JO166_20225 [Deltaproteobacteria bacterium]|nr:hypothetical protein [Deltaproteobacteria bacterium]
MSGLADELYGFDPNEEVLDRGREKLELNNVRNAALHGVALRDRSEMMPFFPSG